MKAVIVDASGSVAVALRDDGQFVKLKNIDFSIGQEIRIAPQRVSRFPKQVAVAASAALVLTAGAGFGLYEWNSPYSYVSLDASPSIEYALNRFDVVIAVNGLNEEGQHVADTIGDSVKNTKIDKALEITVAALSDENYISNEDASNVVVSVYSDNDSKVEELITTVNNVTNTTPSNVAVAAVAVDKDTHNQIEAGHKVVDNSVLAEDSIEKDTNTLDEGDVAPAKGDEVDVEAVDSNTGDTVDESEPGIECQKESNTNNTNNTINTSNTDDKNKTGDSSTTVVDKTEQKPDTSGKNDNKSDKKNDNKNNKNDAPAKTDDAPAKEEVAPPRTKTEAIEVIPVADEEVIQPEFFGYTIE